MLWNHFQPDQGLPTDLYSRALRLRHREGSHQLCRTHPGPVQAVAHPLGLCPEQAVGFAEQDSVTSPLSVVSSLFTK